MTSWIASTETMSGFPRRVIEKIRLRNQTEDEQDYISSNDASRPIGIVLIILTSSSKQFRLGRPRFSKSQGSPMRFKGRRNAGHLEVVECSLFATPNSLKSLAGQNLKSPFSNTRAITYKLCPYPSPTAVQIHPASELRAALN